MSIWLRQFSNITLTVLMNKVPTASQGTEGNLDLFLRSKLQYDMVYPSLVLYCILSGSELPINLIIILFARLALIYIAELSYTNSLIKNFIIYSMTRQSSYIVNTLLNQCVLSVMKQSQLNDSKILLEKNYLQKYGEEISEKYVDELVYQKNGFQHLKQNNKNAKSNKRTFRSSCNDAELFNIKKQIHLIQKAEYLQQRGNVKYTSINTPHKVKSRKHIKFSQNNSPLKQIKSNHNRALTSDLIRLQFNYPIIDQDTQQKRRLYLKRKALYQQVQSSFNAFQQHKSTKPFKNLRKTERVKYIHQSGDNFDVVRAYPGKNNKSNKDINKKIQSKKYIEDCCDKQNNFNLQNLKKLYESRIDLNRNKFKQIKALVKDFQDQQNKKQVNLQQGQHILHNPHRQTLQTHRNYPTQLKEDYQNNQRCHSKNKRRQDKKSSKMIQPCLNVEAIVNNIKLSKGVLIQKLNKKSLDEETVQQFPTLFKSNDKNKRHTKRLTQRMSSLFKYSMKRVD